MSERVQASITQYAELIGVLADLVQRAPDLPVWSLSPHVHDGRLTVSVLAATRQAAAAWGDVLGSHDEHLAASGSLHCRAAGVVAGVAVDVLAIVAPVEADDAAVVESTGEVAA